MSVTLVCNARLPSERAHPLQVVRMWQAFNALGLGEATLVHPFRFQREKPLRIYGSRFWEWYGMTSPCGPHVRLPTFDAVQVLDVFPGLVNIYSRIQQLSFSAALAVWFASPRHRYAPVWSREILALPLLGRLYPELDLFYELHRFPGSHVERQLGWLRRTRGVICITEGLRQRLVAAGHPEEAVCVAADGFDPGDFEGLPDREGARRQLGIDLHGPHFVYTGHLYEWKGVDTIVSAAAGLAEGTLHLVGGMTEDIAALRGRVSPWPANVILHGHRPPGDIPLWLRSADAVLVPNSAQTTMSREETSPLKLYEAMASGTPLLASDLPSLREAVDSSVARLVPADDPVAWRTAMAGILGDDAGPELAANAQRRVAQCTWQHRARCLQDFMAARRR